MKNSDHLIGSQLSKVASTPVDVGPTQPVRQHGGIEQAEADSLLDDIKPSNPNNKTVLVAEDNFANQLVAKTLLSRAGFIVTTVNNGREAIKASQTSAFNFILMDIEMPVTNGIEATQFIRSTPGPNQNVLVIALTAHASASERYTYRRSGIDHIITKPLRISDLNLILDAQIDTATIAPDAVSIAQIESDRQDMIADILALPYLDCATLDLLIDSAGASRLDPIIKTYWSSADGLLSDMQNAHQKRDRDHLKRIAHTLKGASANIGLMQIGQIAAQLQNARSDMIIVYLEALNVSLARSREAMNLYLRQAA